MTVEQTNQLIQLILNSVLMVTACVIVLGVLLVRHTATVNRMRNMNQEYFQLLSNAVMFRGDRLFQVKNQLVYLRQRYRATHTSLLWVYYALLLLVTSTFLIALRTMINWQWLIPGSLVVFTVGVSVLLMGVGLALLDFQASKHSLWAEITWVLNLGEPNTLESKQPKRLISSRKPPRRVARSEEKYQRNVSSG